MEDVVLDSRARGKRAAIGTDLMPSMTVQSQERPMPQVHNDALVLVGSPQRPQRHMSGPQKGGLVGVSWLIGIYFSGGSYLHLPSVATSTI